MTDLGTPIERLILSGGGTRHPLWLQLQADIFNRPVFRSAIQEATARGAAILAGIGIGMFNDAADAVIRAVNEPVLAAVPDPARSAMYQASFREYATLAELFTQKQATKSFTPNTR